MIFLLHTPRIQLDLQSTFEFVVATTAAMELPGGIEKDELGVALSYAIMLGGGAPSNLQTATPLAEQATGAAPRVV